MGQIDLFGISERGVMRGRVLTYRIQQINTYWSQLHIEIPVHYRWAFDYAGLWTDEAKQQFRTAFERNAHETWSRRFRVFNGSDRRFEVLVHVLERGGTPASRWEVVVYPQDETGAIVPPDFPEPIERVRCAYDWRGWTQDMPRPVSGPELRHVAVCFLRASSANCNPTPGSPGYTQRGGDHEVGHMLGMEHPGGLCSETAGCYGRTPEQRGRIMGAGSTVTAEDYGFAVPILNHEFNVPLTRRVWRLEPDPRHPYPACR